MKIVIDIKTDNSAFEDDPFTLEKCLETTITKIGTGWRDGCIADPNGNLIGKFKVTGK